jgi:outer membrane beta-barrel protein
MRSIFVTVLLLGSFLTSTAVFAAKADQKQTSLEDQLKTLDAVNQSPAEANHEKLYSVQSRYLPLKNRSEITAGVAQNMTADSFLNTQQFEVAYRFHFNDKWSVGLAQAWVNNQLKSETQTIQTTGAIPEEPFASSRTDLTAEYNFFYGKFRWGGETVSYFDMYGAVGPGIVQQNTGSTTAAVADVGFAFWLGKWGSARAGLKDYAYNETYLSGVSFQQNLHAHIDIGYIF